MDDPGKQSSPGEDHSSRDGRVRISVTREGAKRPFVLDIPDWLFNAALASAAALTVLIVGGGVLTARMGAELRRLHEIEEENAALRMENRKIEVLAGQLEELDGLREQILMLAGAGPAATEEVSEAAKAMPPPSARPQAAKSDLLAESARRAGGPVETLRPKVPSVPIPLLPERAGRAETRAPAGMVKAQSPAPAPGSPSFRWPVEGVVSQKFQINTTPDREHHGVDIAAPHGTPVLASAPGIVARVAIDSVFGYVVVVDHEGGLQSLYGHNSRIVVGMGDSVRTGQEIAKVGSTGVSSAPHLHFEIRRGGRPVDPSRFMTR